MSIRIHAKNIDLNPESERYIRKKFNRIQRRLPSMGDATLELSRTRPSDTRGRFRASLTLNVAGRALRSRRGGVNLYDAIDSVADVADGQLRRFKGKNYLSRTRKARRAARNIPAEASIESFEMAEPV